MAKLIVKVKKHSSVPNTPDPNSMDGAINNERIPDNVSNVANPKAKVNTDGGILSSAMARMNSPAPKPKTKQPKPDVPPKQRPPMEKIADGIKVYVMSTFLILPLKELVELEPSYAELLKEHPEKADEVIAARKRTQGIFRCFEEAMQVIEHNKKNFAAGNIYNTACIEKLDFGLQQIPVKRWFYSIKIAGEVGHPRYEWGKLTEADVPCFKDIKGLGLCFGN